MLIDEFKGKNTAMRAFTLALGITLLSFALARGALADDLMFGCWQRPTCGKVCKLVCEPKKLAAVGYGCKCNTIAVPGPSCEGCKHCAVQCCPSDACGPCGSNDGDVCCGPCCKGCCCEAAPAKIEFCWHDWFTNGCARPRTVKLLTKYQAEKKIDWYHWEVVDASECCCADAQAAVGGPENRCRCVYKAAAANAQVGDTMEVSAEEQLQVSAWIRPDGTDVFVAKNEAKHVASAEDDQAAAAAPENPLPSDEPKSSAWHNLAKTLRVMK